MAEKTEPSKPTRKSSSLHQASSRSGRIAEAARFRPTHPPSTFHAALQPIQLITARQDACVLVSAVHEAATDDQNLNVAVGPGLTHLARSGSLPAKRRRYSPSGFAADTLSRTKGSAEQSHASRQRAPATRGIDPHLRLRAVRMGIPVSCANRRDNAGSRSTGGGATNISLPYSYNYK